MSELMEWFVALAILATQDADRPAIAADDLKALKENNVFSPRQKREAPTGRGRDRDRTSTSTSSTPSTPKKPLPPMVTGVFLDAKEQMHVAVVEDRNIESSLKLFTKPKFMKVGEEVAGYTIDSIVADRIVVKQGSTVKELRVGESFPGGAVAALPEEFEGPPLPPDHPEAKAAAELKAAEPAERGSGPLDPDTVRKIEEMKQKMKGLKKGRSYDVPE